MSEMLWQPDLKSITNSSVFKLMNILKMRDYNSLHQWSINNLDEFWTQVWYLAQIIGDRGEIAYLESSSFTESKFFPNASLNIAENLLSNNLDNKIAITSILENGTKVEISWDQLRVEVCACAKAMLSAGVQPGDRVVAWAPNLSQVIIYSIAALAIGAVVSTASPDFAAPAVLDRFAQIEPVLLLAASNYQYSGKNFNCLGELAKIKAGLPTLKRVILIDTNSGDYTNWNEWVSEFKNTPLEFKRFSFNHPGFILFSSGTTGKPKCIIHSAAGILLKLRAEQLFNFDLSSEDKIFFYTTCGWMMWNWLLYCLASKASIVLYEGSPTYPNVERLLDIAERENCTRLGVSAKYIDLLKSSKIKAKGRYQLSKLKTIISTGSVLSPESFEYIYQNIKSDIHLASISGGTDICGCFVSAVPSLPVYAGEIQGACLGLAVDIFDESGIPTQIDQKGELVCTKPFPTMPLGFWNDDNDINYRSAYFSKFKGVWTHGDFAAKSSNGGFVIFGRSDATLNAKGVRIGTAEIYRVVEQLPEILESLAVAKEVDKDTKVILFVTLAANQSLNAELINQIKSELKGKASPRHVPDLIIQAPELPRTKSNKLVEIAVADLINGRKVRNIDGLANPKALDWFASVDFSNLI
jgi:acetoacetyl-CoA synthetase